MKTDSIAFALPDIGDAEIESVVAVLRSGWITTGAKSKEFESRFASATDSSHAVVVNSCTAALHLALEAVGLRADDEVVVPAMTFAATAEVVRYFGAKPVIVDVRAGDNNIDPGALESAITARTKAVLPVHFAGQPCDMDEIVGIARAHGIFVIDDAAHCFPCEYRGRSVGTLADITAFSFYATKTITTGEGGAATTENDAWADRMRMMSLHGISRDAWKRYSAEGSWYYEIVAPGYKYNLTDVAAAMGLAQLARAQGMSERRAEIADAYDRAFRDQAALELLERHPDRGHSRHLYVIRIRPDRIRISRDRFIEEMKQRGVGCSVHFIPLHLHPYYRDTYGYRPESLPVARESFSRSVSLPIYSRMSDQDVQRVIESVLELVGLYGS